MSTAYYTISSSLIDSELTDFPVGIKIAAETGFMSGLGSTDWQNLHATVDGVECYVEVDIWDTVNDVALLWVKVSSISDSTDTTIKLEIGVDNYDRVITTPEVFEDFTGTDDDSPNYELWATVESGTTFDIQSNKLQASHTGAQVASIVSRFVVSGDFDIQVDFDILTDPSTATWAFQFFATPSDANASTLILIDRRYDGSNKYYSNILLSSNTDAANASTSDTSGKLRIVRSGQDITTYYYSSGWQVLNTRSNYVTVDLYVMFRSVTTSSMTFDAAFDNFQINSCDGITGYVGETGDMAAQAVWDENFVAVYHLSQDPDGGSGTMLDSTSNENNGAPSSTPTQVDTGDDLGLVFNGSSGSVNCGSLNVSVITVEALLRYNVDDVGQLFAKDYSSGNKRCYQFRIDSTGYPRLIVFKTDSDNGQAVGPTVLDNDTIRYTAGTFDGSEIIVYSDDTAGTPVSYSGTIQSETNNTLIGTDETNSPAWYEGNIYEIRLSDIARSAAWLKAAYNNLTDLLLTYSATDPLGGGGGGGGGTFGKVLIGQVLTDIKVPMVVIDGVFKEVKVINVVIDGVFKEVK